MKIGPCEFPEDFLKALRDEKLVIFAGAGVSMGTPANLPNYDKLAEKIGENTGETFDPGKESPERFLGRLKHKEINVHAKAQEILKTINSDPTDIHEYLLRLFEFPERLRLVTTNYDNLFERACRHVFKGQPKIFDAPALPIGSRFKGIVHIHGSIGQPEEMIMTDEDFGRAYLTEGWARRFLIEVFKTYTVLFVGYSYKDLILEYLTRAMPLNQCPPHFSLVADNSDNIDRWKRLAINPIVYKNSNNGNHANLREALKRLSETHSRSVLEWQSLLSGLGEKPPPIDEEDVGLVETALKEGGEKLKFLTKHMKDPKWLEWLDSKNYLSGIFEYENKSEMVFELAKTISKYAIHFPNELFLLISKHGMKLNGSFWTQLCMAVFVDKASTLTNEFKKQWAVVLLEKSNQDSANWLIQEIGYFCLRAGFHKIGLEAFKVLTKYDIRITEHISFNAVNEDEKNKEVSIKIVLAGSYHEAKDFWSRGLKRHLATISELTVNYAYIQFSKFHLVLSTFNQANYRYDGFYICRSAIETHIQDEYGSGFDVLIDAARDSLEWLAYHEVQKALRWYQEFAYSDVSILRRLAIHTLDNIPSLSPAKKMGMFLKSFDLHDFSSHHEIFVFLKNNFKNASKNQKKMILKTILKHSIDDDSDVVNIAWTDGNHLNWLSWLVSADPECHDAKNNYRELRLKYPDWEPCEHPEFTHWHSGSIQIPDSKWSPEELLSKPACEWVDQLLNYQPMEPLEPDRFGLNSTVSKAIKEDIDWGLDLAKELEGRGEWDTDLWGGIIYGFAQPGLSIEKQNMVLKWLQEEKAVKSHLDHASEVLLVFVKDIDNSDTAPLLHQLNNIASRIWAYHDHAEVPVLHKDYLFAAINNSAGKIAEFWVHSLSAWRKIASSSGRKFNEVYAASFFEMITAESEAGRLAQCFLASQLSYILSCDEMWTKKYLLPLFKSPPGTPAFLAVWDGFFCWGKLSPKVVEYLEEPFFSSIQYFCNEIDRRLDRFVEIFTFMTTVFVEDPFERWLPEFFRHATAEARRDFNCNIRRHLPEISGGRITDFWNRWLKVYWNNRLNGIPASLQSDEIQKLIEILPHLSPVFEEAVEIAIQMPPQALQGSFLFDELDENSLCEVFPEPVAKLMVYLDNNSSQSTAWYGADKIIGKLLDANIGDDLKNQLRGIQAKYLS